MNHSLTHHSVLPEKFDEIKLGGTQKHHKLVFTLPVISGILRKK